MAKKKKSESGKRIAKRVSAAAPTPKAKEVSQQPEPEEKAKSSVPERIQEKDAGFGTIKIIIGVVVALIIGASIFSRFTGSDEAARGNLLAGEQCSSTQECSRGTICYSYKGDVKRCYKRCSPEGEKCEPGYTCTSSASSMGRKKTRVRSICVEDSKL